MRSRILVLILGLLLSATPTFSQMYSCIAMQGTWKWNWDNSQYELSQDNSGSVTGLYLTPFCPGYTFPITGTITSGSFTFKVTNLNQCQSQSAVWASFTGLLGQPGCNYAYGSWSNSLGGSDGFGENQAYPTSTANVFTRPVDLPTSETSQQSGSWNTTLGAPWHQTLAPNSPSGEFSGRQVFEYASGTGTDSCWFLGSIFKYPFNVISEPGFAWDANGKNLWGADFVGWTLKAVQFYREQHREPCSARFQQQMVIDAAYSPDNPPSYGPYTDDNGVKFYGVPYEVNTLGGDITGTSVISIRNGQVATNTTWK